MAEERREIIYEKKKNLFIGFPQLSLIFSVVLLGGLFPLGDQWNNMMVCEIIKITEPTKSGCEGYYLTIKMKDVKTNNFYITYVVPADNEGRPYRNYEKWRKVAQVGKRIFFMDLKMKSKYIINADSTPLPCKDNKTEDEELEAMAKDGIFG